MSEVAKWGNIQDIQTQMKNYVMFHNMVKASEVSLAVWISARLLGETKLPLSLKQQNHNYLGK